jgi:hypothetical protein
VLESKCEVNFLNLKRDLAIELESKEKTLRDKKFLKNTSKLPCLHGLSNENERASNI